MDKTNHFFLFFTSNQSKHATWELFRLLSTRGMARVNELTLALWSTLWNRLSERWYGQAGLPWWPRLWSFPSHIPQRWGLSGSAHHHYSHVKSHRAAGGGWNITQRVDSRDINTESSKLPVTGHDHLVLEWQMCIYFQTEHLPSWLWLPCRKYSRCSSLFSQSRLLTEPPHGHLGSWLV